MSQLLYYLLLKPLSYLPLPVLYILSDLLFLVVYRLAGFRKKVVSTNMRNSFPGKSPQEITRLEARFYHHFCDLIVESIRMFSMPAEEAIRRCRVRNPEILEAYFHEGRSVIVPAGHYNNWELAAMAVGLQISYLPVGIYAPLRNKFFNKVFLESRSRFRLLMVPKKETTAFFADSRDRLTATLMGADQSPTFSKNPYWTRFLNQDTAVMIGTERFAREYNYPVVFGFIHKLKRGHYELEFELVEDQPTTAPAGSITERHTRLLEQEILDAPEYWLWTHKRWKRKKPEEVTIPGF